MNISKQFQSEAIYKKYDESIRRLVEKEYDYDGKLKDFSEVKEQGEVLEILMSELYESSGIDMFYWRFCPSKAYEFNYPRLLEEFRRKYPDTTEIDFIENELNTILNSFFIMNERNDGFANKSKPTLSNENRLYIELDSDMPHPTICIIHRDLALNIFFSTKKKIEYLSVRKETIKNPRSQPQIVDEISLDYSNNSKAERIVFLYELGILDYLEKKMITELHGFSANKLAEIVSTFTDIGQGTAQPMLNPMYTKDINNKNNPLSEDNLKTVKQKLMKMGFNKTKSD